ncbi:MAG TPA: DUF2834 domain-containing protein [Thermoanaerobaculia bacterium]|nr:DUF2834 domain-containing protein [Thermoanaerobaculia bacterium]
MRKLYAALAVAGFVLPMSQFALFVRDHGLDLQAFLTLPFANFPASTFAFDLLTSCVVFFVWVYTSRVPHRWLYVAMTLLVGLSFSLPMFLLARKRQECGSGELPLLRPPAAAAAAAMESGS